MKIPKWYRAIDLVKRIAAECDLEIYSDFRVFECDEDQKSLRPIMEDESIFQLV